MITQIQQITLVCSAPFYKQGDPLLKIVTIPKGHKGLATSKMAKNGYLGST